MAKQPKQRAKFKIERGSITKRVAAYDARYPGRSACQLAMDEGINVKSVYSARTANKKKGLPSGARSNGQQSPANETPLNERDIVAISKIGVVNAERIIKLLKQLS
jgi:hypothetical protein